MEWIKTILNAVRAAMDGVSAKVDRLKSQMNEFQEWRKSLSWVPVVKQSMEVFFKKSTFPSASIYAETLSHLPKKNSTYIVTINNVAYSCVPRFALVSGDPYIFLGGNLHENIELPVTLRFYTTTNNKIAMEDMRNTISGELTLQIVEVIDNLNTLPEVFIPERLSAQSITLESSTYGSSLKFIITVDDTGTVKATKISTK